MKYYMAIFTILMSGCATINIDSECVEVRHADGTVEKVCKEPREPRDRSMRDVR